MEETKKTTTTLEELTETANQKYSQLLGENKLPTLLRAIGLFPDQRCSYSFAKTRRNLRKAYERMELL